jgi:predicted  nucleic acid-binding Zn-ribbon protein
VPTEKLGGNLILYSDPVIIPISNGTKFYTRGSETRYIHDMYVLSDLKVKELEPEVKNMESDLTYQKEKIAQLKLQIQEIRNTGNSNSYNAQVAVHNTLVSDYNSRLNDYRELFSRYEKYALVHNYILEHMYDRKGVFEYVKKNMPA